MINLTLIPGFLDQKLFSLDCILYDSADSGPPKARASACPLLAQVLLLKSMSCLCQDHIHDVPSYTYVAVTVCEALSLQFLIFILPSACDINQAVTIIPS